MSANIGMSIFPLKLGITVQNKNQTRKNLLLQVPENIFVLLTLRESAFGANYATVLIN